jgi:hypothetical protein
MDYEVFLLSRMSEEYLHGQTNRAERPCHAKTGRC